jgi:hypothetical protein
MRALPRVEVAVEPETLERSAHGSITGRIWLRDGSPENQADFPEVGWSDFPVALLGAWTADLQRLARAVPSADALARCHFMDGPYSFTVGVEPGGAWRISCWEDRREGRSEQGPQWITDQASFLGSLIRSGRSTLAHCDSRGWWNNDTEALRRRMEAGR